MKNGEIYLIEARYPPDGAWQICRSYDYDIFYTKKAAREFIKNNRDALPSSWDDVPYPTRVATYRRVDR